MPSDGAARKASSDVIVRAYRAGDRDAVRDICCRTAFRNRGARAMLDDAPLFGDYWTSYYTDYEPEASLVVEQEGRVIGYLIGCVDTRRYLRIMATRIVPRVVARLGWRAMRGRYRDQPRAHAFFRWLLLRAWREAPAVDVDAYPAHYHANVLREGYWRGLHTSLALKFLDAIESRGVTQLHVQVLDRKENGVWQRFHDEFRREHPNIPIVQWERDATLGRTVFGLDWALSNRAWGASVDHARLFVSWIARRHRL